MVKCTKCGAEVIHFIGKLFINDSLDEHMVDINICDCWVVFLDATKGVGFDAKIDTIRKCATGQKFGECEKISSLGGFR